MRNIETRTTKTGPDDAGLNLMLTEARMEERRAALMYLLLTWKNWRCISPAANSTAPKLQSCCVTLLKPSRTKRRRSTDG